MMMTQRAFEQQLDQVRSRIDNPAHGLYRPDSITWRIQREAILFLCAGRAALLQLAHPYVAHAVEQHSETRADPVGRFNRTFLHMYSIIFGDLDSAIASARSVRRVHDRIHGAINEDVGRFRAGHRYSAHDVDALLWVCATLIESSVIAYEIGVGPLSAAEKDAYYEEVKLFAQLFGIPEASLPASFPAFERYCASMVEGDEIAVGRPAREIAHFLLMTSRGWAHPVMRWNATLTAGLLPPRIREAFGLPWSQRDKLLYKGSIEAVRRAWPKVPARLRHVPAYVEATRRIEGRPGPDRMGRAFEQMLLRAIKPTPGPGEQRPAPRGESPSPWREERGIREASREEARCPFTHHPLQP
jgi:uncharacterized protein (DUF2236 family)